MTSSIDRKFHANLSGSCHAQSDFPIVINCSQPWNCVFRNEGFLYGLFLSFSGSKSMYFNLGVFFFLLRQVELIATNSNTYSISKISIIILSE